MSRELAGFVWSVGQLSLEERSIVTATGNVQLGIEVGSVAENPRNKVAIVNPRYKSQ